MVDDECCNPFTGSNIIPDEASDEEKDQDWTNMLFYEHAHILY